MMKTITAYFSYTEHTRGIAKMIHQHIGGELFEIKPVAPYSLDYDTTERQANKEASEGFQPELADTCATLSDAELILIGTPNWFNTMASPVRTFLAMNDFTDKKIAIFCTNGGGGLGHIEADIHALCSGAILLPSLNLYEDGGKDVEKKIAAWLKEIL